MALADRIQQDMVAAMKAKDETRLGTLRMIKAALMKLKVDSVGAAGDLSEAAELQVLSTLVKQRREAAEAFRKGGRADLAAKEESELQIVESYMPAAPTAEELEAAVTEALAETGVTSLKQMGVVVNAARARLAGKRIDGKALADLVRGRLS